MPWPGRMCQWSKPVGIALQVPLADDRGLVAGLLQQLGKGLLGAVEAVAVAEEAVDVAVLAGQDDGPAGAADRVGHQAAVEEHPFAGEAIDVRRLEQLQGMLVGADGLRR